ncbi:hypothetical protein BD414DRAFT_478374 [Trametes punicea]|nr:hypothetical protein BD414DRAFT_478374 [Trametes punicea]
MSMYVVGRVRRGTPVIFPSKLALHFILYGFALLYLTITSLLRVTSIYDQHPTDSFISLPI